MRTPNTEDELIAILREGKPVHAIGSGTKLHHGPAPVGTPESVSLRGLGQITEYSPGDLVVGVQAGCRLADLQAELGKKGQWLPLDPPYPDATIGGLLATNSSGPRRLAYGTLRDSLIGLRVVGPDGTVTRSGGKVVKNVTGYDLHKMHIGAFGTLGVLLDAHFKVRPKPDLVSTVVFPCESVQDAHALLLKVHTSPLRPSALEALDGRLKHLIDGRALAIVVVEGSRSVLDRHYRDLEKIGGKHGVLEAERADPLWNAVRKLPVGLKDFVRVRIAAKPHELPRILPQAPLWIQAGCGIARVDLEPAADVAKKITQWNERAAQFGGYAVAESAPPGMANREKLPWGVASSPLMRALRKSRDPEERLNPGKDGRLMDPIKVDAPTFEQVSACVHCGLCLEACPTYKELRVEMDSPRGRIYLMKGILEERLDPSPSTLKHLDQCLDCRACETACPSGVPYADILEKTRTLLEPDRKRSLFGRLFRWFGLKKLLPSRGFQAFVFLILWVQQILGLTALARFLGRKRLLPGKLAAAALQAPSIPFRSFRGSIGGRFDKAKGVYVFPAKGAKKRRVALFTGCLADRILAGVNRAAVRVLVENGCEVEVLPEETCCGALHIHNGARDAARDLGKRNVAAFNAGRYDAVVSTAPGCSAELKHYGGLFNHDRAAEAFEKKVKDISEFLEEIGCVPPGGKLEGKVAYDEPCHLLHAQKISAAPQAMLKAVPGLQRVPLEDADACCGSAGVYSITEPELSKKVLARKIDAIKKSGATIVATGNPGCILQIRYGLREAKLKVRVAHPIELLAESYARSSKSK